MREHEQRCNVFWRQWMAVSRAECLDAEAEGKKCNVVLRESVCYEAQEEVCWFAHQVLLRVYPVIVACTRKKTHVFLTSFISGGMCSPLYRVSFLHTLLCKSESFIFPKDAGKHLMEQGMPPNACVPSKASQRRTPY